MQECTAPSLKPDNQNGTFTNPIMWGDWSDPDLIRVDDKFYLVSTSMHYVPGCPIAVSEDLVNWEMAGYALDRYDEDPKYDMQGGNLYLYGAWATTIRIILRWFLYTLWLGTGNRAFLYLYSR